MIHCLAPLTDARWPELLDRHPGASVFHSRGWLEALKRTYGYEPIAFTTTASGPLENALPACGVKGFTGRRLVSLPFSDHCDPIVDGPNELSGMIEFLGGEVEKGRCRSFQLRPRPDTLPARHCRVAEVEGARTGRGVRPAESARYWLHTLDLAREPERVFDGFHRSNVQRAIRRAEREGLTYEAGTSEPLLSSFYRLLRLTRRRHFLPPQPIAWFRNLVACLGDKVTVHVASKDGQPVAGILTLSSKKTMVYKYGGSDAEHHRLGGMPFLFWRAIQGAQAAGIETLDLGRSDLDQPGLVAFKDHLGAVRSSLTYYTYPVPRRASASSRPGLLSLAARRAISHLPDAALDLTGRLLYKHFG